MKDTLYNNIFKRRKVLITGHTGFRNESIKDRPRPGVSKIVNRQNPFKIIKKAFV